MRVIGLTGGIATGKSTVSAQLAEEGAVIIDADALARDAVRKGRPAWRRVIERFGRAILTADGEIDRGRLGALVFADETSRKDLEAIIHPVVFSGIQSRIAAAYTREADALVVLDVPLLLETDAPYDLDLVVVVYAPESIQLERLQARDGFNREDALARIRSQMPIDKKAARADIVIDNSGTQANTRAQVAALIRSL